MEDPQAPEELARIHEQLWQTVLQFGNFSASQERNRIARDLHDSLGHALTALNIQLQTAVKLWQLDPARAEEFLTEAQRLGSTAVREVRQTVKALRTDAPEERSIETLLDSLVENFHRSTGISPIVSLNLLIPLPPEIVVPIYRIFQEGLNNICKYAQATEVQLQLITTSTSLGLVIQDNGRGFNLQQTERGFGLRGMQERVALLQGRFQIDTELGQGCRIRAVIPLHLSSSIKDLEAIKGPEAIASPGSPPLLLPLAPVNAPPPASKHLSDLAEVNHAETVIETHRGAGVSQPNRAETAIVTHGVQHDIAQTVLQGMPASNAPVVSGPESNVLMADVPMADVPANSDDGNSGIGATCGWTLNVLERDRLTQILMDFIGPIAPTLVQTAIAQAQSPQDLITQLANYIPSPQQAQFAQQTSFLLDTNLVETNPLEANFIDQKLSAPAVSSGQTAPDLSARDSIRCLDQTAIAQCEQELTIIIGPVAHFLIQDVLTKSPDMGLEELVERLVTQLPDGQKALQFKHQMLSSCS